MEMKQDYGEKVLKAKLEVEIGPAEWTDVLKMS